MPGNDRPSGDVATPRQVAFLWNCVREKQIEQAAVLEYVAGRYGSSVESMSKRDASALIEGIQSGSITFPNV